MFAKVNLAALLCFATALSGVHGSQHGLMRRDDTDNSPSPSPPGGSPTPSPPSGSPSPSAPAPSPSPSPPSDSPSPAPSPSDDDSPGSPPSGGSPSGSPPSGGSPSPNPSPGGAPTSNTCAPPPGGWTADVQPLPSCGNDALLDWCHAVDPKGEHTTIACWTGPNWYCGGCDPPNQKLAPLPPGVIRPNKFPACVKKEQAESFCKGCPTNPECGGAPAPPSQNP